MSVVMVSGLRVTEGVLLFAQDGLLLCEGFTLSPSGDVCCTKHHPSRYDCAVYTFELHKKHMSGWFRLIQPQNYFSSVRDSFISSMLTKESTSSCRHWLYEDIKEARFMRFLLEVKHPTLATRKMNTFTLAMFLCSLFDMFWFNLFNMLVHK